MMRQILIPSMLVLFVLSASSAQATQAEVRLPSGGQVTLELTAVHDFAPGARVVLIDGSRVSTIEQNAKRRYRTKADVNQSIGLALTVDNNQVVSGTLVWQQHHYDVSGQVTADGTIRVLSGESHHAIELRNNTRIELNERSIPTPAHIADLASGQSLFSLRGSGAIAEAVVAVDTDNEFLASALFNNNTALASDWIADMFNAINLAYERDLGVTLVQGETILRVGSDDPWSVGGTPASREQLEEFGDWWQQNQTGVERVFALLLSGKSSSQNRASGIAWVDGYCETQSIGGGYSINQVFTNPEFSAAFASKLVAHELGHNFGSVHTHCYTPEIDQCFNDEDDCYSGPFSCPGMNQDENGTLMSYCNFTDPDNDGVGGANCGQTDYEFAPRVIDLITTRVADELISGCLATVDDVIFADSFESL